MNRPASESTTAKWALNRSQLPDAMIQIVFTACRCIPAVQLMGTRRLDWVRESRSSLVPRAKRADLSHCLWHVSAGVCSA